MAELGVMATDISWSSISTDLLLAELVKRQVEQPKPVCGSSKKGSYDTPLHVGALILIFAVSTICCGIPLLPRPNSKGRHKSWFIFYCQHFGTGVLLATAFLHLLPMAFTSLTDPCLPYAFNKGYRSMAGLVAMLSALSVVALESYLSTRGAGHTHNHEIWDDESEDGGGEDSALPVHNDRPSLTIRRPRATRPPDIALNNFDDTEGLIAGASPLPGTSPLPSLSPLLAVTPTNQSTRPPFPARDAEDSDQDSDLDLDMDELHPRDQERLHNGPSSAGHPGAKKDYIPSSPHAPTPEEQQRLLLQCILLEAGILFHSVFIGMALSVATGPPFVVFLIAISLHQTFEGLALGTRIAAIQLPRDSVRPWLMVLAFGATTPLGQLIGLIVHEIWDPKSQTGLLMVGFMNAISSGLLLFAGLVQLLAEDFLTEKSYKVLQGGRRLKAYLAVLGGVGLMAGVRALG